MTVVRKSFENFRKCLAKAFTVYLCILSTWMSNSSKTEAIHVRAIEVNLQLNLTHF